jgi:hypothetical protein
MKRLFGMTKDALKDGGSKMGNINIELLREASNELRQIKDGKGGLSLGGRIEAAKALQHIDSVTVNFEDMKNRKQAGKER